MAVSDDQTRAVRDILGRDLRRTRQYRDPMQEKLSPEAGVDQGSLTGVEPGRRNVAIETVARSARALHVPVGRLFEEG